MLKHSLNNFLLMLVIVLISHSCFKAPEIKIEPPKAGVDKQSPVNPPLNNDSKKSEDKSNLSIPDPKQPEPKQPDPTKINISINTEFPEKSNNNNNNNNKTLTLPNGIKWDLKTDKSPSGFVIKEAL